VSGTPLAKRLRRVYADRRMFFLIPRHIKYGREFTKDAKKLLAYKRDLLSEATIADFEAGIQKLESAVKEKDARAIEEAARALDVQCGAFVKPSADSGWRENCEVFLVAIVVALGVRTYFLQPFTIPTGSMQPTLNGILATKTSEPPPNVLMRLGQAALWGRAWVDVIAKEDDVITDIREIKTFPFTNWDLPPRIGTRTEIVGRRQRYVVDCPMATLLRQPGLMDARFQAPMQPVKAGEVLARGYYETGDHVFVDKMSYNFRPPHRGEVFVFNTQKLPTQDNRMQNMTGPSQFYIKRLAGTPGDTLQVRPPELFINGQRAQGYGFERVMACKDGYRGYSNAAEQLGPGGQPMYFPMKLLGDPEAIVHLEPRQYFAMGDNSFHSSDSRDWGPVPEENIMGCGVFVYWPFTRHFGLIR
jgi:signal peptidase I